MPGRKRTKRSASATPRRTKRSGSKTKRSKSRGKRRSTSARGGRPRR